MFTYFIMFNNRIYCYFSYSLGVQNYPRKGKKKAAREERTRVCVVCKKKNTTTYYCIVQRPEKGKFILLYFIIPIFIKLATY